MTHTRLLSLTTLMVFLCFGQLLGQDSTNVELTLGQPHPELGGHIFYLNGEGGGLIVYESDLVNTEFNGHPVFRWAEPEHLRTVTNLSYYNFNNWDLTAAQTDDAILSAYGDTGHYAALEVQRQLGGEWRLPTATEAYWINYNLTRNDLGNFAEGIYWTSSEVTFDGTSVPPPYAVAIDMGSGELLSKMAKIQALRVRPVRTF